ncbi:P450-derived glycosyltransferase activator [Streptomyces erythrochromogenes]|uniref:P450-derived glycosyltransferase activator n=1 Tax=Streptomyces erythrochromogenes TaxID=285574 RepID=A0ABZ1Q712_9ACTN|nr:P450-derived glycosyltransferase activator [Streptomyces erythrochromogenes]MCX5582771.1 P450-derived glycosyltransferase activator [Streptomyces erythrochromogenes]
MHGTWNRTDIGELGRRLQRAHGEVWLHQVKGDPYADLLRGHAEDPRPGQERIRALGPLWRSTTGAWVTADHRLAGELLGAGWPHRPLADDEAHVPVDDAGLGGDAAHYERLHGYARDAVPPAAVQAVSERVVGALAADFDLVTDLAEAVPTNLLAATLGPAGADRRELARACTAAGVVLDGLLCPQRLDVTRRAVAAVGRLRELLADPAADPEAGPGAGPHEAAVLLATAGVRTAASLIAGSVLAVADHPEEWSRVAEDPGHAALVVAEVLRHDPPVRIHPAVALADVEFAGQHVRAGERVVVLVAAANRDPEVFDDPDRFVTGRPVEALVPALHHRVTLPFARAQAEAVLRALVAARPRPRRSAGHLRSRRSPVTGHLLGCPLTTG